MHATETQTTQVGLFDSLDVQTKWQILREQEEGGPVSDVTLLSFGAGQDSTSIFHRLHYDPVYRKAYAPGRLYIATADTGDEHPETLEFIEQIKIIARDRGWQYAHITADMGYHSPAWQSLMGQFHRNNNLCGTGLVRSCTSNLKLTPLFRWLADQLVRDYDLPPQRDDKGIFHTGRTMRAFAQKHGRIRTLLGIAAKEEKRMYGKVDGWLGEVQVRQYPMVYEGVDRLAAIDYIESVGQFVPPPSHCMRCHYQSPLQLLLLSREHPDKYEEWVEREEAKISKNAALCAERGVPNYGVFGVKLLPQVLAGAQVLHGHLSTAEMKAIAFTRGCSQQAY